MRYFTFFLALTFLVGIHQLTKAQISISPNPVNQEVDPQEFDVVGKSLVKNESARLASFKWERTILEMSADWACAVCDVNLCYTPTVNTAEFDLEGGEEGTLDVHVYPGGFEGAAIVHIVVTDLANDEITETGIFLFNQTTSTVERINDKIKIYPNPVSTELYIDQTSNKVDKVELLNIQGQVLLSQTMFDTNLVHIGHLPSGNYLVRMYAADGNALSVNLLIKQ